MAEIIGIFCGGLILGLVLGAYFAFRLKKPDGELVVDDSDSKTTRWSLNLKSEVETIPNKKLVIFRVRVK